jgi:hypothetical protein
LHEGQASAGGTFCIIFVRLRPSEIGHHAIPKIFGDVAAVTGNGFGGGAMIRSHGLAPFFWIELRGNHS